MDKTESLVANIHEHVTERNLIAMRKVLNDPNVAQAQGSSYNHQAWSGGYLDHVGETINTAINIYPALKNIRLLPFTLEDAIVVLFVHDLEKPWKHTLKKLTKASKYELKYDKITEFGFELTEEQWNAVIYCEGENDDYSPKERKMGRLAAFCHACDVISARLWHDEPKETCK